MLDDSVIKRLIEEAGSKEDVPLSEKMIECIIAELRWKAIEFEKTSITTVYNGDVVKAADIPDADIQVSMRAAVNELRANFLNNRHYKGFFENSSETVQALVDPSLWPLVYGRSRIVVGREMGLDGCIEKSGRGREVPVPAAVEVQHGKKNGFSHSFQWLPCEVKICGEECK